MLLRLVALGVLLLPPFTLMAQPASGSAAGPGKAPTSQPAGGPRLDLLYTGETGGVDSRSSTGSTLLTLWDELIRLGGSTSISRSGFGVLAQGGKLLLDTSELRSDLLAAALSKAAPRRGKTTRLTVLEGDQLIFIPYPPAPALDLASIMRRANERSQTDPSLKERQAQVTEVTIAGRKALLFELEGDGKDGASRQLDRDPLRWKLLWSLEGEARLGQRRARYLSVLKPFSQSDHRAGLLRSLKEALGRPLLLSAGNEVSTVDPFLGKSDADRELSFATLARLGYDALVPGHSELYFGLKELQEKLRRHRVPLVATNLLYAAGKAKGEPVFPPYLLLERSGLRVAVIGLLGSQALTRVSDPAQLAQLRLQDPIEASNKMVQELYALPETRPHLVVVLANLRGEELQNYLARAFDVDIVISDFRSTSLHRTRQRIDLEDRYQVSRYGRQAALITHSSYAMVGHVQARFAGQGAALRLARLQHELQLVDGRVPRDEALHRQLMQKELAMVAVSQSPLLPPVEAIIGQDAGLWRQLRGDPQLAQFLTDQRQQYQLWISAELWSVLLANVLLDASGAEVALVRKPERLSATSPGPMLELYVQSWLPDDARLIAFELDGATLRRLALALQDSEAQVTISGLARDPFRVSGRPLVDKEHYQVVLSSDVAALPAVARVLEGKEAQRRFVLDDQGRASPAAAGAGKALQVRQVALARLRALRQAHPSFDAAYCSLLRGWLRLQGSELTPRWSLAVEGLTASFTGYGNYPQNAWLQNPGVRETRTVSPANYALGLRGGLALLYDSANLAWETRGDFKLARQVVQLDEIPEVADVTQEAVDDLVGSSELRLKFIDLALGKAGRVKIVPYANGTFDSEFTATKDQLTGRSYPHQKELRVALGLVSFPGAILQEVRLAGLFKNDFSVPRGQAEGGLLAGFKLGLPLWRAKFQLGSTLRYFPDTDADTVEDLGLILESTARLEVPFTRDLSLALLADLFFYVPKVTSYAVQPEDTLQQQLFGQTIQRGPALSLILSAGLTFDHLWKL